MGGRATALTCVRKLLLVAAHVRDDPAGLRFARERLAMEVSSFSTLALALAHERCGDVPRARVRFAEALRLSRLARAIFIEGRKRRRGCCEREERGS